MPTFDRQYYAKLAMETWLKGKNPKSVKVCHTIFLTFKHEMGVSALDLLFEARKEQDTQRIVNVMERFYSRMVTRGLCETSAWQYCVVMREFYKKNRMQLPRMRKPEVPVALEAVLNPEPDISLSLISG